MFPKGCKIGSRSIPRSARKPPFLISLAPGFWSFTNASETYSERRDQNRSVQVDFILYVYCLESRSARHVLTSHAEYFRNISSLADIVVIVRNQIPGKIQGRLIESSACLSILKEFKVGCCNDCRNAISIHLTVLMG